MQESFLEEGNKYVKMVLDEKEQRSELARVREYIKSSFDTISGFVLPSPGDDFIESCSADSAPDMTKLRGKFVEGVRSFVPWVISVCLIGRKPSYVS